MTAEGHSHPVAPVRPSLESRHNERDWTRFGQLLGQLALLVFVIYFLKIENDAFARLFALTVAGFAVHYLLPLPWRQTFFAALSVAGLFLVLGPVNAGWVVAIGLGLLGLAHLPIPVPWRAAVLLIVGLALALPRWGLGSVPWSPAIWPILGSLFVFRLLSYLYDLHHGVRPTGVPQVLAYFFLLPNVCFPLFPVIDFKRFSRGYYDAERHGIHQVGIEWIWRGVMQLVFYRLVYFHLTLDPVEVADLADLAVSMLSTYLLYVRLSGYFHVVTGILHLFGFNLPETHHRYFLASSFTDYWRRINIYWKDFMMKVFYYPAFFKLRKLGDTTALVVATIVTFVATWCLHMAQWFWIRGSILVEWNDIIFWTLFGTLVLGNSLYEIKHGRTRTIGEGRRTLANSIRLVLQTTGTFLIICVMWSFWSAESATDWALMVGGSMSLPSWGVLRWTTLAGGMLLALGLWTIAVWQGWERSHATLVPTVSVSTIVATLALLSAATSPYVTTNLAAGSDILDSLRLGSASALNRRDAEAFQRGYYENLMDVSKFNSELWARYQQMPTDFVRSLSRLGLSRATHDERDYELVPLKEGRFVGSVVRTNRWGMRDQDYEQAKPRGVIRLALLGPSTAMGSGVDQHESFEALLEERLNRGSATGVRYEILNFGVAGYSPLQMLYQLDHKVFAFQPDVIMYLAHASDVEGTSRQLQVMIQRRVVPEGTFLVEVARMTGITPDTRPTEGRRRMKPFARPLQAWVYQEVVRRSMQVGAMPVMIYMETVTEPTEPWRASDRADVLALASESGLPVLDLTGAYGDHLPAELWIEENDVHPNALGHRLLADRLESLLRQRPELLSPVAALTFANAERVDAMSRKAE